MVDVEYAGPRSIQEAGLSALAADRAQSRPRAAARLCRDAGAGGSGSALPGDLRFGDSRARRGVRRARYLVVRPLPGRPGADRLFFGGVRPAPITADLRG